MCEPSDLGSVIQAKVKVLIVYKYSASTPLSADKPKPPSAPFESTLFSNDSSTARCTTKACSHKLS
jgi:hypothetical protein